ncbi:MAG: type VI secretion system tip protein VgrG, partial [Nitrospira sp.]|nr:type VI secretion system tip protein VgrG [Nitrospira sp.]
MTEGEVCRGESTYPQLQAGFRFLLVGHPRNDFNQEYVITSVEHQGSSKSYRNTFTCIPSNLLFRPSPATPRPVVTGVVPGIVVGPPGEVKHVDQFGRVRVQFPWRNPSLTNKTAGDVGWVRVAQLATGNGTSAMWIPEINDEVVVAFEHGNPNRPVVLGSMWNGKDLSPTQQPPNKFLPLFQSRSPTGTLNEILFDPPHAHDRLIIRSRP